MGTKISRGGMYVCVSVYICICAHMYVEGIWIYELTLSLLNIDRLTYNS